MAQVSKEIGCIFLRSVFQNVFSAFCYRSSLHCAALVAESVNPYRTNVENRVSS